MIKSNKILLLSLLVVSILIVILYSFFQKQKDVHNILLNKQEGPSIELEDLSTTNIDTSNFKKLKKRDIKNKNIKKDNVHISVSPTKDFYDAAEKSNYKVKETLKAIDFEKPPVQGEVTVEF